MVALRHTLIKLNQNMPLQFNTRSKSDTRHSPQLNCPKSSRTFKSRKRNGKRQAMEVPLYLACCSSMWPQKHLDTLLTRWQSHVNSGHRHPMYIPDNQQWQMSSSLSKLKNIDSKQALRVFDKNTLKFNNLFISSTNI